MNIFPHPHRLTWPAYGIVVLFCLAIFLPGFFTLPPIDRDEPRFAQASKQMLQSGNLVDIRFGNEARHKKPIGIYWLQAGAAKLTQSITGIADNVIWPYRIPSLVGAILSVLLTAMIGAKLLNAEMGFAAAILLASSLLLNVEARLATTDAMLLATLLGCQFVLVKAFTQTKPLKIKDFLLFWISLAAGFLIKGPIILLGPLGTLITLKLFKEDIGFARKLKPIAGIILALVLIMPWFYLIMQHTNGAFLNTSAGKDLFAKIWEGQNWGIGLPGLYTLIMPISLWPASLPFMLAIPYIWASRHDRDVRFCLAWMIPIWLVFELTLTKLPHYVLPAFPAMCILAMRWLASGIRDTGSRLWKYAVYGMFALVSFGMTMLAILAPITIENTLFYWSMTLATLAFGLALSSLQMLGNKPSLMGAAPLPVAGFIMMLALLGCMLPNLSNMFLSVRILANLPNVPGCPDAPIATAGYNEPSLMFLSPRKTTSYNVGEGLSVEMKRNPCLIGICAKSEHAEFLEKSPYFKLIPEVMATFSGFNYGRGQHTEMIIYRTKQP